MWYSLHTHQCVPPACVFDELLFTASIMMSFCERRKGSKNIESSVPEKYYLKDEPCKLETHLCTI